MTKMNQKEAVFQAVVNVLKGHGITVREGVNVSAQMTREFRAEVNAILFEGFKAQKIELDTQFKDDSELKAYVSGLQSNWLRKDKRLNGGVTYVPKQPGARTGQGDAQLKELKKLLALRTDPTERAEIQKYIDMRTQQLAAEKVKQANINVDALPAALRKFAS